MLTRLFRTMANAFSLAESLDSFGQAQALKAQDVTE